MLMSWNMRSLRSSGDERQKWSRLAGWLTTQPWGMRPAAVALQGCGQVPQRLPGVREQMVDVPPGGNTVGICRWTIRDTPFFVSHLFAEHGARRIELAIVSGARPRETVVLSANPQHPAIGVNLEGVWVFSLDAGNGAAGTAEHLLATIRAEVGAGPWIALGTFGQAPEQLQLNGSLAPQDRSLAPCHPHILAPGTPTSPRKAPAHTLDYAVRSDRLLLSQVRTVDMDISDHLAILFA